MDPIAEGALDLARALRKAVAHGVSPPVPTSGGVAGAVRLYEGLVVEPGLRGVTRKLFADGHYAQAVGEGFKFVNNLVKARAGYPTNHAGDDLDGAALMTRVFGVGAPLLKFNDLKSRSKRDVQTGYMRILEGGMIGVRNPRAHEHNPDEARTALELLAMCNHLARLVNGSTRVRKRRAP